MIDYIYLNEASVRLAIFLGGLSLFALWEYLSPKRQLTQDKFERWINNIFLLITGTVLVRILIPAAAVGMAYVVEKNQWGLVNYVEMPFWLKVVVTYIILDLMIYVQHAMFHVLPVLWRFHRVHHSDLDCDVSTGLRFHPVEILLSILFKLVLIVAIGAPVLAVIFFEAILNFMSMFTHSNIRLNSQLERVVRWFVVTPDMHRIHHSQRENETNSNFGFNISLWDRIFATYMPEPKEGQLGMTIGLDQFRGNYWQAPYGLLKMPFASHVKGYAINYRDMRNEEELVLARKLAEQSHEKAQLAMELASYMEAIGQHALVSVTDAKGKIIEANDTFSKVSGYSTEELVGQDHNIVNSGRHPKSFFAEMWETISSGQTWHGEICNKSKHGALYWVDTTIVPVKNDEGKIERYISVRLDITNRKNNEEEIQRAYKQLAQVNQRLEEISRVDGLTQVANRRCFDETLSSEVSKLSRSPDLPLTLMLCDIDFFKQYNDTYGHVAGDECLKKVAKAIKSSLHRAGDFVARYGGEEFAIVLSNVDKEAALSLAERIRAVIMELNIEHGASGTADVVTMSIGVATIIPVKETTEAEIIEKADKALYRAKEQGRNNIQFEE